MTTAALAAQWRNVLSVIYFIATMLVIVLSHILK